MIGTSGRTGAISGICRLIAENNEREAEAIAGYFGMLEALEGAGAFEERDAAIADVREIIGDEMEHTRRLNELASKLSGIAIPEE